MEALREQIAQALGWSVEQTNGFSLAMLREMVREKHPELAKEIATVIRNGEHIFVRLPPQRRRRF